MDGLQYPYEQPEIIPHFEDPYCCPITWRNSFGDIQPVENVNKYNSALVLAVTDFGGEWIGPNIQPQISDPQDGYPILNKCTKVPIVSQQLN